MIITAIFYEVPAMADEAATAESITPATPTFTVEVHNENATINLNISKTKNADGYRIYVKEPGNAKYRTAATLKKSGKKERTYTYCPYTTGKHYFKVKAYHKNDGKKAWSETSKVAKVNVKSDMFPNKPEEPKYADITFKDGYAYFGSAPTELVTDKALKAKILAVPENMRVHEYNGDRYFYDSKDDIGPLKYVPVEWKVLKKTDDYALLMTNCIINGGGYDGYQETKTTTWKTSCLYYMLNNPNNYTKSERTFGSMLQVSERVLMEMDICGQKTKLGIPTVEMLTNKKYGFSTSKSADTNRIVEPSKLYDLGTNHKATRNGISLYGLYWVANEKAGEAVCVDQKGNILIGKLACNVYEIGVVNVVKVDLKHCNVYNE